MGACGLISVSLIFYLLFLGWSRQRSGDREGGIANLLKVLFIDFEILAYGLCVCFFFCCFSESGTEHRDVILYLRVGEGVFGCVIDLRESGGWKAVRQYVFWVITKEAFDGMGIHVVRCGCWQLYWP